MLTINKYIPDHLINLQLGKGVDIGIFQNTIQKVYAKF